MRRLPLMVLPVLMLASCNTSNTGPKAQPSGEAETGKTKALEAGANAMQATAPANQFDVYLVGFHPMKDDPKVQIEAHHYCKQVNEDFMQCVLFDGNTKDANMTGVEYIISERSFNALPDKEKKFWHPHNYEILSGELVGPGLPQAAEKQFMQQKMNSYGKTWHVWMTDTDKMPFGEPQLAWSFNRDGEIRPGLLQGRDQRMKIDTTEVRKSRQDLVPLAHPQSGVDELKDDFKGQSHPIPGVTDVKDVKR